MKRLVFGCMFLSLLTAMTVGCSEKAKVQTQTETTTPGGTTTETTTHEVEKSGENPPPANP